MYKFIIPTAIAVVALGAGIGIGAGAGSTTTTVTHTVNHTVTKDVPGPVTIKTVTRTVKIPGPTVYKTRYVPASQGPTGTTIASYSGSGSQNTGSFNVPSTGDYIVEWTYSNNFEDGTGSNFIINDTNNTGEAGNEPNDIAGSGSGSTEDTGMTGSQSFNVQADGNWTIKVISAS
jgi:hypothetical protein